MSCEYNGRKENEFLHDTTDWKIQKDDGSVVAFDGNELRSSLSEVLEGERWIIIVGIQICRRIYSCFKSMGKTIIPETNFKDIIAASLWDCGHYSSGKTYILKHFSI